MSDYHRINGQTYDRFGNPDLVDPHYNKGEYFFKFSYDQLDNVHFPRDGKRSTSNGMRIAPIWAATWRSTKYRSTG